jgi:uncharacterized protein YdhG (YjbR/CyaY superfamily)
MTDPAKPAAKKTAAKTPARRAAAKEAPAKKATAKKATAKKATAKTAPAKKAAGKRAAPGFTEAERSAMKDRAAEVKAAKRGASKADDLETLLEKIAEMEDADRALAERIHAIITSAAPELAPRTWYGMPAYASGGKVVCFFQPAQKFGARYATFGFNDPAHLDEGTMWPTAYALTDLSDADVARIEGLVRRAVS